MQNFGSKDIDSLCSVFLWIGKSCLFLEADQVLPKHEVWQVKLSLDFPRLASPSSVCITLRLKSGLWQAVFTSHSSRLLTSEVHFHFLLIFIFALTLCWPFSILFLSPFYPFLHLPPPASLERYFLRARGNWGQLMAGTAVFTQGFPVSGM